MEKQRGRLPAKIHRYVVVRRSRYQLTAESHRFGRGASLWYVAFLFQALRGGQPSDGRRGAVLSRTGGRRAGSDGAQAKKKAPLSPEAPWKQKQRAATTRKDKLAKQAKEASIENQAMLCDARIPFRKAGAKRSFNENRGVLGGIRDARAPPA